MPKPSDIEVAKFLADFRDRAKPAQEGSPVMDELRAFPQWADASYREPGLQPTIAPPPDPRLPPLERAAAQAAQTPPAIAVRQGPGDSRSIVSAEAAQKHNPWANTSPPPSTGLVFMSLDTELPPPYPGVWARRPGGWLRPA